MERWRQQQHEPEEALNSRVGYNKGHSPFCLFFTSSHLKTISINFFLYHYATSRVFHDYFVTSCPNCEKEFPHSPLLESKLDMTHLQMILSFIESSCHLYSSFPFFTISWHTSLSKHLHLFIDKHLVVYHVSSFWPLNSSIILLYLIASYRRLFHLFPLSSYPPWQATSCKKESRPSLTFLFKSISVCFLLSSFTITTDTSISSHSEHTHTRINISTVRSVSLSLSVFLKLEHMTYKTTSYQPWQTRLNE